MKKLIVTAACLSLVAGVVYARKLNKEQRRLEECGTVMSGCPHYPDDIPADLLQQGRMRHRHSQRQETGVRNWR